MEKLGQRRKTAGSLYRRGKAGGKKEDLLNYWDYGTKSDPVSEEELDILEDEWLKSQGKQLEHIRKMKTDRWGDRIPYEKLPQWVKEDYGKGYSYKGGPLEIRRGRGPDVMEMLKSNPDLYNEYLRFNSFFKNVKVGGETPTMEDWNLEREEGYPFTKDVEGLMPLKSREIEDKIMDSFKEADNKYTVGM